MTRRKLPAFSLLVAALLCWQFLPANTNTTHGGTGDGFIDVSSAGGLILACPEGDGDRLDDVGATITVTVLDVTGQPIPNIPAYDFWIFGCDDAIVLCGGGHAIDADSATGANGQTTISGALAAGGYDATGVYVIVMGIIDDTCLPIKVVSPDINGDLVVDVVDLAAFAASFPSPPNAYLEFLDFNGNGTIDIVDFSLFAQHYMHVC